MPSAWQVVGICARTGRQPPLQPNDFLFGLAEKAFSVPSDQSLVGQLYRASFSATLGRVMRLDYESSGWRDEEARPSIAYHRIAPHRIA
jgi:hypothetical protein